MLLTKRALLAAIDALPEFVTPEEAEIALNHVIQSVGPACGEVLQAPSPTGGLQQPDEQMDLTPIFGQKIQTASSLANPLTR